MYLFQDAAAATTSNLAMDLIKIGGGALVAGFFAWVFNRQKNNSDIEKNESEIIQNYVKIISELQADIDKFIERVRTLRGEVESIEDEKRKADKLIDDVKKTEKENVEALHRAFKAEKEKLAESVVKLQMIVNNVMKAIDGDPLYLPLRLEAIRIVELLHYLKEKLQA